MNVIKTTYIMDGSTLLERAKIVLDTYTDEQLQQIISNKTIHDIQLYELVKVSNNSRITESILKSY